MLLILAIGLANRGIAQSPTIAQVSAVSTSESVPSEHEFAVLTAVTVDGGIPQTLPTGIPRHDIGHIHLAARLSKCVGLVGRERHDFIGAGLIGTGLGGA